MKHRSDDSHAQTEQTERFYTEIWPEAPMLMRTAISLTTETAEAEDVVQDTLLKAFKNLDRLEKGTHPRAWLLTLLRNTWIDRWRKRTRRPDGQAAVLDQVAEPQAPDDTVGSHDDEWTEPEELLSRFSDQEIIKALRLIPENYRWTLLLVDVQSLTMDEAAVALDTAPGTIKSRLHRGRAMLRDHLHDFANNRGWVTPSHDKPVVQEKGS